MERLSISRKTLYNWVHKKYLIPIEIGGKKRFKLSDVNAILNNSNNSTINKYEND
jgi:excisionase family DNA binding protein